MRQSYRCREIVTGFLGSMVLAGCATGSGEGTRADAGQAGSAGSDCIINRGIRDFETLDNQNLILFGPGNRAYHVILTTPSINLEGEFAIGVFDRDGRICPFGGDAILVEGPLDERIPIRSIEAIDDLDVEALKVRFGKLEPPEDAVTVTDIE